MDTEAVIFRATKRINDDASEKLIAVRHLAPDDRERIITEAVVSACAVVALAFSDALATESKRAYQYAKGSNE